MKKPIKTKCPYAHIPQKTWDQIQSLHLQIAHLCDEGVKGIDPRLNRIDQQIAKAQWQLATTPTAHTETLQLQGGGY